MPTLYLWILTTIVCFEITSAKSTQPPLNITQCGNLTCYHGAPCRTSSSGADKCLCKKGYQGDTCQNDMDECRGGHDPCFHRGLCSNTFGGFKCDCFKGWLNDADEHCAIKDNSTTEANRVCKPGWIGEWCQDQCLNDSMCLPHQVCVENHAGFISQQGHICRCATGWHGVNCTHDINECSSAKRCSENRSCVNTPGSYICTCLSGWKGDNCTVDIDECLTNTCQNSANCTNMQGSYNCKCVNGWTGVNCSDDVDECKSSPCSNRQTCTNTLGTYECHCLRGWTGINCDLDINECLTFPCLNAGNCTNTNGSYYCNCTSGWQGDICKNDIDECEEHPCNGTLACTNNPGSYTCTRDHKGVYGNASARQTNIIVGSVLGVLLLLGSIAMVIWIWKKKKRSGRRVSTTFNGNENFT